MKTAKRFVMAALCALAVSGCAGTLGTSPKGLEVPIEKAALTFAADVKAGGYKIVTTDELKKWFDDNRSMIIISSLSVSEDRIFGKIPGAISAEMPKTDKDLTPEDKEHLLSAAGDDKNRTIVIYCGFVACRRSHVGAKLLVDRGYKDVYRYPAGIAGWGEAGYGLVKQ